MATKSRTTEDKDIALVTRRSVMTLFSDPKSHYSHRVRIVLAEKDVAADLIDIDPARIPEALAELSPYGSLPTLVDRDLSLYDSWVMMEYLDERFPHPPLMPVYPVARALSRLWKHRIERDWCVLIDKIMESPDSPGADKARKELTQSLLTVAPIFGEKPYFMHEEFTLVDCCLGPIFWRLNSLGINLPGNKQTKPLSDYMKRLFSRKSFHMSMSRYEKELNS